MRWCSRSHTTSQVPTHDNGRYVKLASQTASPRGAELDSCSIARRRSSVPAWRYASVVATDLCRKSWASRRTVPGEKHDLARAVGKPVESQNGGWLPVLRRAVTEVAGTGCTISGTPGVDSLTDFSGADRICAFGGSDSISGGGGRHPGRGRKRHRQRGRRERQDRRRTGRRRRARKRREGLPRRSRRRARQRQGARWSRERHVSPGQR